MSRLFALAGLTAVATMAAAGPQTYARNTHVINAGAVVLDADHGGNGRSRSGTPYVFYVLDKVMTSKPAGWSFQNPFGPSLASADIATRWNIPVGTSLTRRNAPYWEVNVSRSSDTVLSAYDVLVLSPRINVSLNASERDRLRKFVDKGGLLWIDLGAFANSGSTFDPLNGFPVPFGIDRAGAAAGFVPADFSSPMLNVPNRLTPFDIQAISRQNNIVVRQVGSELGSMANLALPVISEFGRLQPVATDPRGSRAFQTLSYARIGDGFVVISARGVASAINRASGAQVTANDGNLDAVGNASARLAFNMISMLDDFRQPGGGSRKSGSSFADVNAPLMRRFDVPANLDSNPDVAQPAIYRGMVFISHAGRVACYDAKPSTDLDGDGSEDDGIRDWSTGAGKDLIWQSDQLGDDISAPTVVEVPDAVGGLPRVQVLVTTSNGSLIILDGEPSPLRTRVAALQISPPGGTAAGSVLPPTAHEGVAYMAVGTSATNGRVWAANLKTGQVLRTASSAWFTGDANGVQFPGFTASPTVAYIHTADNAGGVDKVLYVPFRQSNAVGNQQPGFASFWIGTRGEQPGTRPTVEGSQLVVTTRAGTAPMVLPIYLPSGGETAAQGALGVRLTLLRSNGDPVDAATMANIFTGNINQPENGILHFTLNGSYDQAWFDANVSGVRIDYNIDWGRANNPSEPEVTESARQIERGRLLMPTLVQAGSSSQPNRQIVGNLAVTQRGTIFAVLADPSRPGTNGALFAFREDLGRGSFRCVMRYDLFSSHRINQNQGTPITYESNFRDSDAVKYMAGPLLRQDYVQNFTFAGGPSVRGDRVYVTAKGFKGFAEVAMLMAFQAEPDTPQIKVGSIGNTFSIVQPDLLRSTNRSQPEIQTVLQPQAVRYDPDSGVVHLENLMNVTRGPITNCISTSQPVLIRRVGQGDLFIEPEKAGGRWSPLLWYSVLHGMKATTSPVVAGNTIYFAGTSLLPYLMENGSIPPNPLDPQYWRGQCYAIEADIPPNDPYLVPSPERPWNRQLVQAKGGLDGNGQLVLTGGNSHIVWPQYDGISSMQEFRERLNQTLLPASSSAYGIIAANNTAVAWGSTGIFAYGKADIVLADQGRISRIDANGNLLWSTDATISAGSVGELATGRTKALVRPTRAYALANNDMLVVDAGGNRVVRMDPSGLEIRSIDSFTLDPGHVPAGFEPNNTLLLSNPNDAITFSEYRRRPASGEELTGQQPIEYWTHTVIADTGNRRIVDVVDRYSVDAEGNIGEPIQIGTLFWHSPPNLSGRNFTYTSLVNIPYSDPNSGLTRPIYVAGIGNATPTRTGAGLDQPVGGTSTVASGNNGGIVVIDTASAGGGAVVNRYRFGGELAGALLWNDQANSGLGGWDTSSALAQLTQTGRPIGSVSSLSALVLSPTQVLLMVAESGGVYEVEFDPSVTTTSELNVYWMLPNSVYRSLRRVSTAADAPPSPSNAGNLVATYAKRLNLSEVLVVNGYYGPTRGVKVTPTAFTGQSPFRGEVFQIDGPLNFALPNLGLSGLNIRYSLRRLGNGRDIQLPVFADRR